MVADDTARGSTDDTSAGDAYAVLGVPRGAGDAAITAAHRALARQHHPDVAGEAATVRMMAINAAFDAIRTASRRAAYETEAPAPPGTDPPGRERLRWRPPNDGTGKAGPPPGRPSGSVLDFGRHKGWSIGEIARVDPGYLVWLEEHHAGRPFLDEIDAILRRMGYRPADAAGRAGDRSDRAGRHGRRGSSGRR